MRIFDCVLYNGEIEVLLLRLHELHEVVDVFVVVEAAKTFSGRPKELRLQAQWKQVRSFARKIRYVVIGDDIEQGGPWDRERFQRNSIERGLLDAVDGDLICASDVDEIPRAEVIRKMRSVPARPVGFRLLFSYFFLNYRNVAGPEANLAWCSAFPRQALDRHTPEELRYGIRDGSIAAEQIDNAGWHFSYLTDLTGIKQKNCSLFPSGIQYAGLPGWHRYPGNGTRSPRPIFPLGLCLGRGRGRRFAGTCSEQPSTVSPSYCQAGREYGATSKSSRQVVAPPCQVAGRADLRRQRFEATRSARVRTLEPSFELAAQVARSAWQG